MKKTKNLTVSLLCILSTFSIAQPPSITKILVSQRTDGSGLVDLYFNLSGPASAYNIAMQASFDGGSTYTSIPPAFLSGDIAGISPGSNKHIVWDGLGSFPNTFSTQARLELTASEVIGGGIPCPGMPTVSDIDGNIYNTVLIGSQCWMKENLKTTKYRNGIPIDYPGNNNSAWSNNSTGAYAWYNNDISWKNFYGALYNWFTTQNSNGLCPAGWRIPNNNDWSILLNVVGGPNVGGGNLKSSRIEPQSHPRWDNPNTGATNSSGFSGLPAGYRHLNGSFDFLGKTGYWWSNNWSSGGFGYRLSIGHDYISYWFTATYVNHGLPVRCIKE